MSLTGTAIAGHASAAAGSVWDVIRHEAADLAGREPTLRPLLSAQIIATQSEAESLANVLVARLSVARIETDDLFCFLFRDVLTRHTAILQATEADLIAVRTRDPACTTYLHALLNL